MMLMKLKYVALTLIAGMACGTIGARAEDAKANFEKTCAACHSKDGTGSSAAGKKLGVKDWTDAKVQGEMKDEDMAKAIKEGLKDGSKTKMKAFGDKLTDDDIKALVAYIRAFKK